MGKGFLGTPASLMLDVVVCSLVLVLPMLAASLYVVKARNNYALHKLLQIALSAALLVVVLLFEIDMRLQGGFWVMAKDSPYADTAFLKILLYVHLCFSITTVFVWYGTAIWAIRRFPSPPGPNAFSPKHKLAAWIAVADMAGTVVTGLMVYYYGFWLT